MLWSVALLPLLLAPLVYVYGRRRERAGLTLCAALVVLASLALAGVAVIGDWGANPDAYRWSDSLALTLTLFTAGAVFALTVPLIALPIVVYTGYHDLQLGDDRLHATSGDARLLALLVAFVGAMQLLVLANDLLTLLIAWELVGACSWALIAQRWGENGIAHDAARAFVITRFGDLGLYIAAAATFAGSGGFGYADLATLDGGYLHVAVAGIVLAAAAKSAQMPFSAWLFAAMSGPVSVSALLHAATMVAAGIYLLVRLQPILAGVAWFMPTAIVIGLATALAGGVVGIAQSHAKKLLAASTSAQYGLMWLAVGAGFPGVALLHFVAHAFMKAGLFLSAGLAERQAGSYRLDTMRLGRRLPGVAVITVIFSLALAGMIPLGAAWSKEQIASAANHQATWLALLAALAGGLSALYATRFQLLAYGRPRRDARLPRSGAPAPPGAAIWALRALAGVTLLLSLVWWPEVHETAVALLNVDRPPSHPWLLCVSLALVLLGIVWGIGMTRHGWLAMPRAWQPFAAAWFGLPTLTQGIAMGVIAVAERLAHFDDDVVDAGLRGTAAFGKWLARRNAEGGEFLAEGLPGSLSRLADWGGQWARRAQSGQTHHYYTGIAAGFAIVLIMLVIGVVL
ncbi:NADH:ubiquinone oxidoreductase subunit 5 (chain L)/Multisubunit Na+/H+ antiporter, MnhA subunit [Modicisalibacter muralis]|uniref:NADH:ubiquinone oxidoreductase subunit 5 (Chain L)/Multisubunit Na+/H+ antiporter, MnhA subunit n=1 Tax=Modicisalibacter muralis TaxID=119000 RepID=A0A1G9KDZ9_9GAMM|nr:proton-conducting transporter membrane subunit [Halomonas muralis]SDL47921.1 NADH:ubiquinone oxidoreductase subunit 5 (chain L)/Multisubunit Na+/H+ antiporter, MnhA subunit [Halomonas muralis]